MQTAIVIVICVVAVIAIGIKMVRVFQGKSGCGCSDGAGCCCNDKKKDCCGK